MTLFQILVLAVVQGTAELLPVSSSAHVIVAEKLHAIGLPVVLSDGDVVFQPRKIQCSDIWDTVEDRVLIYLHKERMLPAISNAFPHRIT